MTAESPSEEQIRCNGASGHHLYAAEPLAVLRIYFVQPGPSNTPLFDWIGSNQGRSLDQCLFTEIARRDHLTACIFLGLLLLGTWFSSGVVHHEKITFTRFFSRILKVEMRCVKALLKFLFLEQIDTSATLYLYVCSFLSHQSDILRRQRNCTTHLIQNMNSLSICTAAVSLFCCLCYCTKSLSKENICKYKRHIIQKNAVLHVRDQSKQFGEIWRGWCCVKSQKVWALWSSDVTTLICLPQVSRKRKSWPTRWLCRWFKAKGTRSLALSLNHGACKRLNLSAFTASVSPFCTKLRLLVTDNLSCTQNLSASCHCKSASHNLILWPTAVHPSSYLCQVRTDWPCSASTAATWNFCLIVKHCWVRALQIN